MASVNCAGQLSTQGRKDYSFDFVNELTDASGTIIDDISTAVWKIAPTGPTLNGQFILGTVAGVFVEGVTARQAYRLTVLMETTGGRKVESAWAIGGIQVEIP